MSETKIRWELGGIGMAAAHLDSGDGGSAFVFCSIPGGTPQFQMSRDSRVATPVANAPQIDNVKQFRAFVSERFGNNDSGRATLTSAITLAMVATIGATVVGSWVAQAAAMLGGVG